MIFTALCTVAFSAHHVSLPPGPGPLDNPMKGYASYCEPGNVLSCPSQMAFEETGWNQLEPQEGVYAFDKWEADRWNKEPAKGKNMVIRVYLDYPNQPCATPTWLIDKGVKMTKYTEFGGGLSPDYANPQLQKSLLKFISALGTRYDKDPRIDFVQVGLLGHWGEWHTYPHEDLFASQAFQKTVISAMHAAFPHKPLMARNASYASCQVPWIGFHDDMIPSDTFGKDDWEFLPAIQKGGVADNWKVAPTGGEMVPGAAKQYLGTDWELLMKSVKEAHFTWIGPYCPAMVDSLNPEQHERALDLIRSLGYQYQLKNATFDPSATERGDLPVQIDGENQGVAPFYRPWKVRLALLDEDNHVSQSWDLSDDIRKWLPGPFSISAKPKIGVPAGDYRLAIGVVNPGNGKPEIKFANKLEEADGYTVLGNIKVVKPLTN